SNLLSVFSSGSCSPLATLHSPLCFDLIASNPPYIGRREAATLAREVRDHEPEIALYGSAEGYEIYAGLVAQSAAQLKPRGILLVECVHASAPAVRPRSDSTECANVCVTNDLAGSPRVLSAERTSHGLIGDVRGGRLRLCFKAGFGRT